MRLQKQRESRKRRRGGGDVSSMDKQPAIVQRLSMEAQNASVEDIKLRTNIVDDHKDSDNDLQSGSELDLCPESEHQSAPLISPNGGDLEADLHFEPKSPSEVAADKEKKEEDADCGRYDEGSHSESSQMHSSSSDLPNGHNNKEHGVILPEDPLPDPMPDDVGKEDQDLLQKDSEHKPKAL